MENNSNKNQINENKKTNYTDRQPQTYDNNQKESEKQEDIRYQSDMSGLSMEKDSSQSGHDTSSYFNVF
jgi:hypothetical protein